MTAGWEQSFWRICLLLKSNTSARPCPPAAQDSCVQQIHQVTLKLTPWNRNDYFPCLQIENGCPWARCPPSQGLAGCAAPS